MHQLERLTDCKFSNSLVQHADARVTVLQHQGQHEDALNVASRALTALSASPDAGPVAAMFRLRRGAALFGKQLHDAPSVQMLQKVAAVSSEAALMC